MMTLADQIDAHNRVMQSLNLDSTALNEVVTLVTDSLASGKTVFFCGNGGSASDSQHLTAEFIGRFTVDREPISALCLNTDTSVLTCIANDFSYDDVFSRQIEGLGGEGDILFVISTSGRSPNIIKACAMAKKKRLKIVGLLGKGGGGALEFTDAAIVVASSETTRVQEAHIFLGHFICGEIEKRLGFV